MKEEEKEILLEITKKLDAIAEKLEEISNTQKECEHNKHRKHCFSVL